MAFKKNFSSESSKVDSTFNKIANIFDKSGKTELDELELARIAKEMDMPLSNLLKHTKIGADGKLSLKWG